MIGNSTESSTAVGEKGVEYSPAPTHDFGQRIARLQEELQGLEGRDFQLWFIPAFLLTALAFGFLALVNPEVPWDLGGFFRTQDSFPQLFLGLVTLLILLNVYMFQQQRFLRRRRRDLIRQLISAEETSNIDSLTGVFNRRSCRPLLEKEIARAERQQTDLSVMLVDVDDFKAFNTRFGHLVGDKVLSGVSTVLRNALRRSDAIVRYGGDEFLVIMSDTSVEQAQVARNRFARALENWNVSHPEREYRVGATCGIAEYSAGMTPDGLIDAADRGMYASKLRRN